jgi:hypothetical protein
MRSAGMLRRGRVSAVLLQLEHAAQAGRDLSATRAESGQWLSCFVLSLQSSRFVFGAPMERMGIPQQAE